tara:strand:+ start:670 stop:1080 length:411 start_codon:yes stop_codon:yes gene_type:complete
MKITVQHANRNRETGNIEEFTSVAEVQIPVEISAYETINDCLEYAYRWTNNIEGSWSSCFSILTARNGSKVINGDFNKDVTALEHREDGLGLRSTMAFDRFIVDGQRQDGEIIPDLRRVFECAFVGFKELQVEETV